MNLADQIVGLFKEGFGAYKTYLATRQAAYERKKDKDQIRAINAGEQYIFTNEKLRAAKDPKQIRKLQKYLSSWKVKFFKYH